ncbi:MAG: hypothetical protein AAGB15_09505 [Pseudomonadota bacterium]
MYEWLEEQYPRSWARIRFYSWAFAKSFLSGFTMLFREIPAQVAVLFMTAFVASLVLPLIGNSWLQTGGGVLALAICGVTSVFIAHRCHFSAGWIVSLPTLAQPISFAAPPTQWTSVVAPVAGPAVGVIAAIYLFAARSGTLADPVDLWSPAAAFSTLILHAGLILGAVLIVQALCGIRAVATVHQAEYSETLSENATSRMVIVGALLALGFAPILIFAVGPVLGLIGAIAVAGYQPPVYLLLLIHGVWVWAATSILAAQILKMQIRREAYG